MYKKNIIKIFSCCREELDNVEFSSNLNNLDADNLILGAEGKTKIVLLILLLNI